MVAPADLLGSLSTLESPRLTTTQMNSPLLSQDQCTPLHRAAENGREASCRVLIAARAEVDAKDKVSMH